MPFRVKCPQCSEPVELDDSYGVEAIEEGEAISVTTDGKCEGCGCWFNAFATFGSMEGFRTEILEKGGE